MKIATYDEFKEEVKRQYKELVGDDADARKYWESDEAQRTIKNGYENGVHDIKNKGMAPSVLLTGSASSVAYCLHLMFE